MRRLVVILCFICCSTAHPSVATEVPLPLHPVTIDGDLHEWGNAAWIGVEPAGDGIGLRGVFQDGDDHDAVVLVQWDAEALYVAAAVTDDTLDAGQVSPDQREWQGSGGQRKDRVFYYDHMKVFLREPGVSAGYNLWFAPRTGDGELYWWGGRQRQPEMVRPPIRVAALSRGEVRTFEMAIPWDWMEAYPQPGDRFDAMFLFTDSDRPGEDVAIKISREEDRWIWWQGKLELTGQPQELRPRPEPEPTRREEPAPEAGPSLDPRITEAIARARDAEAAEEARAESTAAVARQAAASVARPTATGAAVTSTGRETPSEEGEVASSAARSTTGSLRARLNRKLLARREGVRAPEYLRALERDSDLSDAQIDTFYAVIHRQLSRVVEQRITSRVDFFVVDMATAAGCRRDQSRKYLVDLLGRLSGAHDEDASRWITAAATVAGVEDAAASAFVREIAHRAGAVFAERGITTSAELIKRGRKESGLEEDGSYALIGALLGLSP